MERLGRLAELIREKGALEKEIAMLIGRPALIDHVAAYIAAQIFHITPEHGVGTPGRTGHFSRGPLTGRSVLVKWYSRQEHVLDIRPEAIPDYYLVFTGPQAGSTPLLSSGGPWMINAVYLFDAHHLLTLLRTRSARLGPETSVRTQDWHAAEIYPVQRCTQLTLTQEQRQQLAHFQ